MEQTTVEIVLVATLSGCQFVRKGQVVLSKKQTEDAKAELRAAYASFNRGDIGAAVQFLDPNVEWMEPVEFPGGGSCQGIEGARQFLTQSRAGAAQVIGEPKQFITAGDRIVDFCTHKCYRKAATMARNTTG